MFRSLKNVLTSIMFALSLSIVFLNSCSEDEAVKDTTAPVLSFINFNNGAEVSDTVSISLNATDDNAIEKVDIYIDSVSVSSLTTAPFVFSWNTNTATDGAHTLKAIVTDKSGNTAQKEVSVIVKNVLVTIDIASNQLKDNARGFVFLSDESGKLITSKEYRNGDGQITLNGSGFTGTKFFLTEVFISTDTYQWSELYTFAQIERGKNWVLKSRQVQYAGTATINFSNMEDNSLYSLHTNGGIKVGITSDMQSTSIRLLKNPSKLFVTKTSLETGYLTAYGLYPEITNGSNSVDLSFLNVPITTNSITLPEGSSRSFVFLYGTSIANNFDEVITIGIAGGQVQNNLSYDFYYPGSAFAGYHSQFYYETEDYFYTHASPKEFYSFDKISNVVNFDYSNTKLSYAADGDFDFFVTIFENENSGWYFVCPKGADGLIPTIEMPSFLTSYTLPSFGLPNGYTVYDVEKCTNYESLKNFIRQSQRGFQDIFNAGSIYTSMTYPIKSTGGRLRKPSYNSIFSFEMRKLLKSQNILNE